MSILFVSGFDWPGATNTNDSVPELDINSIFVLSSYTESGRYNGRALSTLTYAPNGPRFADSQTVIICFAVCTPDKIEGNFIQLLDGNLVQLQIKVVNGKLVLYQSNSTVILATGSKVLLRPNWYWICWKVTIDASIGSSELWIDGILDHNISNTDTQTGSLNPNCNYITFQGGVGGISNPDNVSNPRLIDDLFIMDNTGSAPWNDILPDTHIFTAFPNADISNTWSHNTGIFRYTQIDDPDGLDNDSTYIASNTPGNTDTFGVAPNSNRSAVQVVQMVWVARSDGFGERFIQPIVNGLGFTGHELVPTYIGHSLLFLVEPTSNNPWTPTLADAIQPGIRLL